MGYFSSKIRFALIFLSFLYTISYGTNVTVDADGGANYRSLDSLLNHYQTTGTEILPDTITFTGNDVDTFLMTEYITDSEVPAGGVLFRGLNSNPDSFPVILHNKAGSTHYNLLLAKITFEKLVFTGTIPLRSDAANYGITFRKCIFRGFKDTSCIIFGATSSFQNVFENCLFVDNTVANGLIGLSCYSVGKKISFVNCTFDNNVKLFNLTAGSPDSQVTFKNSIFSGTGTFFSSAKAKSNATYCLTSETSVTGYGTNCVSGNPQYIVATSRTKASDWKITAGGLGESNGIVTGAPADDIGGRVRSTTTPVGVGCWKADAPVKPKITTQPDTVLVNEDSTVTFKVVATGSGLSYGWYKTGALTTKLSDSTKYIKKAAFSDSGAEYFCIVSNAGGADTSKHAVLNVLKKPAITKNIAKGDTIVSIGDTLRLYLKATGSRISYQWYLNAAVITGAIQDSLVINGIKIENDSDSVYCVVKNSLGASVTSNKTKLKVSSLTQDPKIIKEPEATVNIDIGDSLSLTVDAQGSGTISYTWYKNGLATKDSVGAGKKFYKVSVVASDSGVYRCIAKNGIGLDTSIAVTVTIKTDTPPKLKNPIIVECTYTAQSDSINVILKKIPTGTARDSITSMLIFYGSATFGYVWDTILVNQFPAGDSLSKVYISDKLLSDLQTISVNVFLKGINSLVSDTAAKSLQVGINRPQNTISLSVKEAHERTMDLQWIMTDGSADSIRIWTGKEQVPLTYNPNSLLFTPKTIIGSLKNTTIENLDTNTHYYFAAQIIKDGVWSTISSTSRTDTFTLGSGDTGKVSNTIKITDNKFDSTTNTLTIRWTVDSTGLGILHPQVAVCFSTFAYPLTGPVQGDSIIELINFRLENVTTIPWNGTKAFDTTYYISMFLRNKTAPWSDTAAAAIATIHIPKVKRERVTLFPVDGDSVYAMSRSILIRKGKNWSPASIAVDNVIKNDTVPGNTNGFIVVSSPFKFESSEQTSDIEIGVRYDALPGEFTANDVYLYVQQKNGKWTLLNRLAIDTDSKMVFTNFPIGNVADLTLLHLLMIDTAAPRVTLSNETDPIEPNEDYLSTISVADNITNAIITLKCGMIDKPLEVVKTQQLFDTINNDLFLTIRSSEFAIKSENSFRIFLTVTDHHNSKTYDLSRQVKKSDNVVTYSDLTWVPVSTVAVLDNPSIDQAFKGICEGEVWKYDSLKFRIFTWLSSEGAANDEYIQYSGDRQDIFSMTPGKVFWLKKRGGGTFNLGAGKTVSIKEPFKVTLPSNQYTDFAMPYDIQLSLADIFSASNISQSDQEAISIYKFDASNAGKQAAVTTIYHHVLGNTEPISDITLNQDSYTAYTIYNATGKTQVLTIPPIDKSYSTFSNTSLAKKADDGSWYIKVESSSRGEISAPVYCVFKKNGSGISKYPIPPYPGSVRVGILDSVERKTYGTIVVNDDRMGYSVPLYITNSSKTESKTVTYSLSSSKLEKCGNLAVYNAETGKLESGSGTSFSVTLEPLGHAYRWALAGDSAYFSSWMKNFTNVQFGFTKITSVAGSVLGIEYTIPFSGVNAVKVMVINPLGQCIWSTTNRNLVPGRVNVTNWDTKTSGRLASGAYIIQVSSLNAVNKQVSRVQKRYLHVAR
jgi:hypothetical protein